MSHDAENFDLHVHCIDGKGKRKFACESLCRVRVSSTRCSYEMTVPVLGRSILCDCLEIGMMPYNSSTVLCRLGEVEDEKA